MKRTGNGAEIKSVRPDDVLFPLFPHANLHPQINYSEVAGEELGRRGKWRRSANVNGDIRAAGEVSL